MACYIIMTMTLVKRAQKAARRIRRISLVSCLLLGLALPAWGLAAEGGPIGPPLGGDQLYQQACAPCHGADGAGIAADNPLYPTFKRLPANLSDPLFNSREPAADWFLVVKYGGTRLGLSDQMPAYLEAFSDEQIESVVAYVKTLADTRRYPPGEFNFIRPLVTVKTYPEDEMVLNSSYSSNPDGPNEQSWRLEFERRVGPRSHLEAQLEYVDSPERSELEEIEVAFKTALFWNLDKMFLLTGGLEVGIPLADDDASVSLVPYLVLGQGFGKSFTLQAQLRSVLPVEQVEAGNARLSGIVHWLPSIWPRSVSPALEAVVTQPFSGAEELAASLVPQLRFGLSKAGHVAFTMGVEVPVTDEDYDYRLRVYLLWDMADGPVWQGW